MIQRLIKRLKGSAGYTLTEMTAVVATAGVLTAVMLPVAISQIQQGRVTAAAGDVAAIGAAVSGLLRDTQDFPMRSTSSQVKDERYHFTLLLSTDLNEQDVEPEGMSILGADLVNDTFTPHFFDNANASTNPLYAGTADVAWKGPYLTVKKLDPWGSSYLVYLKPIQEIINNQPLSGNVIVLSAGANRTLETTPTHTSPQGDDILQILTGAVGAAVQGGQAL